MQLFIPEYNYYQNCTCNKTFNNCYWKQFQFEILDDKTLSLLTQVFIENRLCQKLSINAKKDDKIDTMPNSEIYWIKEYSNFQLSFVQTWEYFLSSPIWLNKKIQVENKNVTYTECYDKGIVYVNDIVNDEGKFLPLEELKNMVYSKTLWSIIV